ncbi:hypothetical protein RHMOL_Rhmol06G0020800 [Rhododendron molle]|uniref:Uncharacterized protein n=1 Tax=Rhododendron molle TaxID=49168 RepID=A0ACC0N9S7_RHOML|nr:hypothetical protein RHMOL_Rhmol06G0020800 [Rhododendron molle]
MLIRIKPPDESGSRYPLGSKFGALPEEFAPLLQAAQSAKLTISGVSFHVGSASTNFGAYRSAVATAKTVFDAASQLGLPKMRVLNIGGGFTAGSNFDHAANAVKSALQEYLKNEPDLTVISEPGMFFAESAFTLATNIFGKRVRGALREYWINDGVFGSMNCILSNVTLNAPFPFAWTSNHGNPTCRGMKTYCSTVFGPTCTAVDTVLRGHRLPELQGVKTYCSTVFGPMCAAIDMVLRGHQLPELQVNGWLVIPNMGAYTAAIGSNFNSMGSMGGALREYWINQGVYGSINCVLSNHEMLYAPFACTSNHGNPTCQGVKTYCSTVFGPMCAAIDMVLRGHQLPELQLRLRLLSSRVYPPPPSLAQPERDGDTAALPAPDKSPISPNYFLRLLLPLPITASLYCSTRDRDRRRRRRRRSPRASPESPISAYCLLLPPASIFDMVIYRWDPKTQPLHEIIGAAPDEHCANIGNNVRIREDTQMADTIAQARQKSSYADKGKGLLTYANEKDTSLVEPLRDRNVGVEIHEERNVNIIRVREHARGYNATNAFTSLGATLDPRVLTGSGPTSFTIHGELRYRAGSLLPQHGKDANYAQLYIFYPTSALEVRNRNKRDVLETIQETLLQVNPFVDKFRQAYAILNQLDVAGQTLPAHLHYSSSKDRRTYNLPTADEIAVVIPGDGSKASGMRDIILHLRRDNQLMQINECHPAYLPLHYVLLFPHGELGWEPEMKQWDVKNNRPAAKRLTQMDFYSYRLFERTTEYSTILRGGKLFQEFLVDAWAATEQNRLTYYKLNQARLRSSLYQDLTDIGPDVLNPDQIGQRYIGPPEATWHIFGHHMHEEVPTVTRLALYLPEMHRINFNLKESLEDIIARAAVEKSTLTGFFA